jgi:hypothetical protein
MNIKAECRARCFAVEPESGEHTGLHDLGNIVRRKIERERDNPYESRLRGSMGKVGEKRMLGPILFS